MAAELCEGSLCCRWLQSCVRVPYVVEGPQSCVRVPYVVEGPQSCVRVPYVVEGCRVV